MATVQTTQQNNQMALSTPKKATNKTVTPVEQTATTTQQSATNPVTGGLIGAATNPTKTTFTPAEYKSDGYTGVQGNTNYSYTPSDDSLVENRITGLLDPNSAMMRKAIANSQSFMAQRGLQSSSIANESALSSMIDKALPIASQDATTYGNADQMGWQNSFTAEQNNLSRAHDASMFDKNGALQTALQNNQFSFQNDQANADRENLVKMEYLQQQNKLGLLDAQGKQELAQMERNAQLTSERDSVLNDYQLKLQDLQQQNQLGLLDAQGKQELLQMEKNAQLTAERDTVLNQQQNQQMERQAQLQNERDAILNNFQNQTNDKQYLQQLEQTKLQYENQDAVFEKQISAQQALDYRNASSAAYNNYLSQVSSIYSNPEMTPEQQAAGVAKLQQMFETQRDQLQAIYGFADNNSQTVVPLNPGGTNAPPTPATSTTNQMPTGSAVKPVIAASGTNDRKFPSQSYR